MKYIKKHLPEGQYIAEKSKKTQIVLHHTVSGSSAENVINWFATDPGRVATAFVIDKKGDVYELFDPQHWAYHIGKGSSSNHNKASIGIEIVNEEMNNGKGCLRRRPFLFLLIECKKMHILKKITM